MATINLNASSRNNTGKGVARKIRRDGLIPASIYRDGKAPTLITIDPNVLTLAFEKTGNPNTLVKISVDGNDKTCLVREVQRHPVSGVIWHVDFYNVKDDEEISVSVPVRTVGRAIGTRMGGSLRLIVRELTIRCLPGNIPSTIDVDVTDLDIGKFIRMSELKDSDNYKLVFKSDFNIVTVVRKRG
ncbi:MAG: 50S ribosomal protein L25 [Myxococcota bacterium]|nr:50S ribosomal protein L25 [Myxococcota bacterium]